MRGTANMKTQDLNDRITLNWLLKNMERQRGLSNIFHGRREGWARANKRKLEKECEFLNTRSILGH